MANKFLAALFGGTKQDKDIKRLKPIVEKVNSLSTWAEGLSHEDARRVLQRFIPLE